MASLVSACASGSSGGLGSSPGQGHGIASVLCKSHYSLSASLHPAV